MKIKSLLRQYKIIYNIMDEEYKCQENGCCKKFTNSVCFRKHLWKKHDIYTCGCILAKNYNESLSTDIISNYCIIKDIPKNYIKLNSKKIYKYNFSCQECNNPFISYIADVIKSKPNIMCKWCIMNLNNDYRGL